MLAMLMTAAALLPQGEGALAGRVLDASGHPAANATVTLLHRPIPRHLDPAHEHRVVVATDERGAFRAKLHDDAVYTAWAATAAGASDLAEGVSAGEFVELRIAPDSGPRTVAVDGLDAWSEAATFRWRAIVGGEHFDLVPVECRDGKLALPPLPPIGLQVLEVLRADGEVLHATSCADDAGMGSVQLPPPASYTVRVHDAAGAPLRDVEILVHLCNYWATTSPGVIYDDRFRSLWPSAGKTDANGTLALRIADPGKDLWLLASKDGFRMSIDGTRDGNRVRGGIEADSQPAEDAPIDVVLEQAPPQTVSLRSPAGEPVATDTALLTTVVWMRRGGGASGTQFGVALPLANGECVLSPPLPTGSEASTVYTTLAPKVRATLGEHLGHPVPAPFMLRVTKGALGAAFAAKVDPAQWRSLHVVAADGRPAARTVVQLLERGQVPTLLRTDRLGRVAFPVTAQLNATVFAPAGAGSIAIDQDSERTTTLALRALAPLTGRVVDAAGAPVAGARVSLQVRARGNPSFVENLALARQLWTRTSGDGRFELLAPPDAMELIVTASLPGQRGETTTIDWDPAAPAKVEISVGSK